MGSKSFPEINLRLGWPNPGLLPVEEIKNASQIALSQPEASTRESLLQYGPDDGHVVFREKLAKWLTSFYVPARPIAPDRICITGGASQNLSCILQTFTDPMVTQCIWMVAPTYFCACRIFDDAGFAGRLRAAPEDDEGLDVTYLSKQLERCGLQAEGQTSPVKTLRPWRKIYQHVIYAVPTFANPSGRIMSSARRESLVRLARKHDALIITDDVYDMLQWRCDESEASSDYEIACQPRLIDIDAILDGGPIDGFGNSVSNGSFSKIIGPGLRTGWSEATPEFSYGLSQTGSTRSGGSASQFGAVILAYTLDTSLPRHIQTVLQPTYARRYHKLMAAITTFLRPLGIHCPPPDRSGTAGGYYVWLQFSAEVNAQRVTRVAAEEYNVLLHPGEIFLVEGDPRSVKRRS